MTLHVVVGPSCAGKSTYVKSHAGAGTPRFDYDEVASTVAGVELGHDQPEEIRAVVGAMRRGMYGWALDPETAPKGDVWVIHSNPSPSLISAFHAAGAEFHKVDPGMQECLDRCEEDGRPAGTAERIRGWYENPPVLPGEDDDEKEGEDPVQKDFKVEVKAPTVEDSEEGVFEAYAAVFGNIDSYGDVIRPGAFAETLKEWEESGNQIPVLYGHDFADPFSNIGAVVDATEDDHGLKISARLDLDNPKAAQVYHLIKERRLSQMSFAFRVLDATQGEVDGEPVQELNRVKLYEVSVVPIGANEETEILTVKSARELISTAVKQAEGFADDERAALSAELSSAAHRLKSPPAPPGDDEATTNNPTKARTNRVRAFFMLAERSDD